MLASLLVSWLTTVAFAAGVRGVAFPTLPPPLPEAVAAKRIGPPALSPIVARKALAAFEAAKKSLGDRPDAFIHASYALQHALMVAGYIRKNPEPEDFQNVPILSFGPTQMAVGYEERDDKRAMLEKMDKKARKEFLKFKRVPHVDGPTRARRRKKYLIDNHHLEDGALKAKTRKSPTWEKADFSELPFGLHWKLMAALGWMHPYDGKGKGPYGPDSLPRTLKGLQDDPYRSLAWKVREAGGYLKTDKPFAEFEWANFFRKNMRLVPGKDHPKKVLAEALELAHSALARGLPGHIPAKRKS